MRNTIRNVTIVVLVLMTSCHVSLKWNSGPVTPQRTMIAAAPRDAVGADAVPRVPGRGRAVRSVRPAADRAAVELRSWNRLRGDGARAEPRLAVSRPHRLGHHGRDGPDRLRVHRRCHAAREAREGV